MKTKDSITLPSSVVMRKPSGAMRMCALSVNEMQRRSWRSCRADDEMAVKRWKSVAIMDRWSVVGRLGRCMGSCRSRSVVVQYSDLHVDADGANHVYGAESVKSLVPERGCRAW